MTARPEPPPISPDVIGMDSRAKRKELKCPVCDGTGTVLTTTWDSPWREVIQECQACDGGWHPPYEDEEE